MGKRVWILGAGASRDLGYPLGIEVMSDITKEVFKACSKYDETKKQVGLCEKCDVDDKRCRNLLVLWGEVVDSVKKIYGHDSLEKIDFEDYFSRVRLATLGYFLKVDDAQKWREAFLRVLYWYWYRLSDKVLEHRAQNRWFENWIKALKPEKDVVVLSNQDLLIESYLNGWSSSNPVSNVNYAYFPESITNDEIFTILKIHGSQNFVVLEESKANPEVHKRVLTWKKGTELENYALYESKQMEETLIEDMGSIPEVCFMMMPDIFKGLPFTQGDGHGMEEVFMNLYNVSIEQLRQADEVFIVGFAARPTDYLASMLLDIGLRDKKKEQVIVVNPSKQVPEGISKNIKEFTYERKTFHQWLNEGGLESL